MKITETNKDNITLVSFSNSSTQRCINIHSTNNTKGYYILGIVPNNENTTVNKTDKIPKEMFFL